VNKQLTSRALGLAAAGINLVVCAAVVTLFVVTNGKSTPDNTTPVALPPTTRERVPVAPVSPVETTTTSVSESSTPALADDLQEVSGPGGMATAVPTGWPSSRAPGPGAVQATDPADAARFLRYGGSPVPDQDGYDTHVAYQSDFSKSHKAFQSMRLERTVLHGAAAVDWEFEWDAPEGRRHVRSVYWRTQGYEYFVYASSLVDRWPQTQPILDAMITHATP
jgi:hypothetical protein